MEPSPDLLPDDHPLFLLLLRIGLTRYKEEEDETKLPSFYIRLPDGIREQTKEVYFGVVVEPSGKWIVNCYDGGLRHMKVQTEEDLTELFKTTYGETMLLHPKEPTPAQ